MKELNLTLINARKSNCIIKLDGKLADVKSAKRKRNVINYETSNNCVHLSINTFLEMKGKYWFITSIFYFIISIFGLLDVHSKIKYKEIVYEADIKLSESVTNCNLRFLKFRKNEKAIFVDTDATIDEKENIWLVNKTVKKRYLIMLFIKLFILLILLSAIIYLLIRQLF